MARIEIECPTCEGRGCDHCDDGVYKPGCPHREISSIRNAIEVASMCEHALPVSGGILDQAAWFMRFKQRFEYETNLIRDEQWERKKNA